MDPRERWQALQAQLTLARTSLDAGDRAAALAAIDSALAIDPDFLAAHSLRERALQPIEPSRPLVSAEGYAQFEQRARRRRVDRRVDAAREALATGRLKDAAAALDEVVDLDPNLPELAQLTAALDALRKDDVHPSHAGRWIAAAAAFVVVILGASWLQEAGGLVSRPLVAVAPLVSSPEPLAATGTATADVDAPAPEAPVATAGNDISSGIERAIEPPVEPAPTVVPGYVPAAAPHVPDAPQMPAILSVVAPIATPGPVTVAPPPPAPATLAPPVSAPSASVGPLAPPAPPAASSAVAPASTPSAVVKPDDDAQVQQVLQRYRNAYEGLDARSARAVWPAVNEGALARAFSGLESQNLTFDACDVQLHGDAADATCHGSAKYVPKIGSREPRVESRTWNFTLRKAGSAWQIESARAER